MHRRRKAYERLPLTGGLLNHDSHGQLKPKPLGVSDEAPMSAKDESAFQVAFFDFLRQNEPRMPTRIHQKQKRTGGVEIVQVPDVGTPAWEAYVNHPLYVLTRIRHFPNGGHRHGAVAGQMKAEGVRKGALDIYCDAPRGAYLGARIELKAGKRDPSIEQLEELAWLRRQGYYAHVVWSDVELIQVLVTGYLGIDPRALRGLPGRHAIPELKRGGHDERCHECSMKLVKWWA